MSAKKAGKPRMSQGFVGMVRSYQAKQVGNIAATLKMWAEGTKR